MNNGVGQWQWDDVRFFLALSRERSLSGAARTLGVDHATVGRRIALLEENLGAKLFSRTPDGFATTTAGRVILKQCETMEDAALNLERLVAGHDSRTAGSVRLTATNAMTYRIIVPCIAEVCEANPDLQIDLITGVNTLDVSRREVDLAVRVMVNRPTEGSLVCRKLGEVGMTLYASPQYLANRRTPVRGAGLEGHDLITYIWGSGPQRTLSFMGESLKGARTVVRSNDQFVQLRAAANGLGIAELACLFGDSFPEVVRVWPNEAPTLRQIWLITHEDLRRATRIRLVSSAIAAAFEREAVALRHGLRRAART